MAKISLKQLRALTSGASCVAFLVGAIGVANAATPAHYLSAQQAQSQAPKPSADELKEAKKVEAAVDAAARQQAAGEFLKKYPKSPLRLQVAQLVLQKISEVQDNTQQIALAENFATIFNEPAEADLVQPFMIDAYITANRHADTFRVANAYLARHPEAVGVLTQVALIGIDQARTGNAQFVEPSRQYGVKAVELIEANKKPVNFDDARWAEYKKRLLPHLYQSLGALAYMTKDSASALARVEKAITLNPADAYNYLLLSSIYDDEYQALAQQHQAAPAGPAKDELLKRGQAQMDKVIDAYAHFLALSEGDERFKQAREQIMTALQPYYKYRHNGSTDGLQQLIDKYKTPAATPKP
ncbi:hypothetical protein BH18ACI2_BH18ACI2_05430 [soil metagenome]